MLHECEIALGLVPGKACGAASALARRPLVPQSPGRRHREHPSRRNLHRQALSRRRPGRPARPGRIPLLRNAARRPHEPRPAAVAARAGRVVLARAARRHDGALGHGAARPLHAEHFVWQDFSMCWKNSARGLRFDPDWFDAQRQFRFPLYGEVQHGGVRLELRHALEPWYVLGEEAATAAPCALSIPRWSACRSRSKASRRPSRRHLQRPPHAADRDRPARRIRRRRSLQGVVAAVSAAPDGAGACAADVRHSRQLEPPLARRLRLSRRPSRRPQIRDLSGQFL